MCSLAEALHYTTQVCSCCVLPILASGLIVLPVLAVRQLSPRFSLPSVTMSSSESKPDPHVEPGKSAFDASGSTTATDGQHASYTEIAAGAASSAAGTATNAAVGVKDTMFSMFGGGAKKEAKSDDVPQEEDRSGSAKAVKQKEKEESREGEGDEEGVGHNFTSRLAASKAASSNLARKRHVLALQSSPIPS